MIVTPFQDLIFAAPDGLTLYARDYGDPQSPLCPVLCLPGLTRNSADFAVMAERLAGSGRRVLALDLRGRGRSAWDPQPDHYIAPVYAQDALALLQVAAVPRAVFIGTSLGGIVTQVVAALKPAVLAAALLNDIGPELDPSGLARIVGFAGRQGDPQDWDEAVAQLKAINSGQFRNLPEATWARFARAVFIEKPGGGLAPNYDPHVADGLRAGGPQLDLWPLFDALKAIPTLVLRGALSDLLAAETVRRMHLAKPDLISVEIPDRGHAPLLDEPAAIAAIDTLLAAVDRP